MNKIKLTAALKRKALAAAVMVAVSGSAFADVTIFGIVDLGIGGDSSDNDVTMVDGGEGRTIELPSIWGIKGEEDLGNGLTASFALESDLEASSGGTNRGGTTLSNNGARFWARQSNVSLSNDTGSISIGRIYSPAILAAAAVDTRALFESQSGLVQFVTIAQGVDAGARALMTDPTPPVYGNDNSPTYDATGSTTNTNSHADVFLSNAVSVKFTPGPLNVAVAYSFGEAAGDSGANSNLHAGVTYSDNGLTISGNYVKNSGNNSTDDSFGESQKMLIGAKYKMDSITLAGHYMKGEANAFASSQQAADNEGYAAGVTFTQGSTEFDLAFYSTKNENSNVTDAENDEIILAFRNNLSKRTTLYAKLCNTDRGLNAPAGACAGGQGESDTYYGVGVFHKF